jgi:hypothetical protein
MAWRARLRPFRRQLLRLAARQLSAADYLLPNPTVVPESSAKWVMVAVVGPVGNAQRCPRGKVDRVRPPSAGLLLVLARVVHVQIAVRLQPVLVHLDREGADQP